MALLDLFANKIPPDAVGATLVVAEADVVQRAEPFLLRLSERVGKVVLGIVGGARYHGPRSAISLASGSGSKRLARLAPARVVLLGRADARLDLAASAPWPSFWINAEDARVATTSARVTIADLRLQALLPGATLTGDPLLGLSIPAATDTEFCGRFREFRERNQWVIYFAATGEGEEPLAYASLFQLLRQQAGLMALAPADPARYEPVYRDAIAYRLPTNRHVRLITSAVPHKTRVYYIENKTALAAMYACADVVVIGGTLAEASRTTPDLAGSLAQARATLVGPARRDDPVVSAAVAAGAVRAVTSVDELVRAADAWLHDPSAREAFGVQARAWFMQQAGASERVLDLVSGASHGG